MHDEQLLDVKDLQRILGVGRSRAYELMWSGEFPVIRIGRGLRVAPSDLQEWLYRCRIEAYELTCSVDGRAHGSGNGHTGDNTRTKEE